MAGERQRLHPVLDDCFTLAELSRCCDVTAEDILMLIDEGLLSPQGRSQRDWRFATQDLTRAQSALRLRRDLGVNPAGAALAIDLIDEMARLRERVRVLETLLFRR